MFQMKEQDKTSGRDLNDMEISNLLDKEWKLMAIMMLIKLRRRMDKTVRTSKEIENIRKYKTEVTELKNTIAELGNIRAAWIKKNNSANWKTKQWNSPRKSSKKKKRIKKDNLRDLWDIKQNNICIIGSPRRRRERERATRFILRNNSSTLP